MYIFSLQTNFFLLGRSNFDGHSHLVLRRHLLWDSELTDIVLQKSYVLLLP